MDSQFCLKMKVHKGTIIKRTELPFPQLSAVDFTAVDTRQLKQNTRENREENGEQICSPATFISMIPFWESSPPLTLSLPFRHLFHT